MKDSFKIFLLYSLFIHTLVFSSFFRIIKEPTGEFSRGVFSDTVNKELASEHFLDYDFFESVLSPFMDSAVIESLWQEDSLYIREWAVSSDPYQRIFDPGWYSSIHERARALRDLLEKYRQSPDIDSLFAQSEFLRNAVLEQILKSLRNGGIQELPGELDWKELITNLTDLLKQYYSTLEPGTSGKSGNAELLSRLLKDSELMRLWKEAMLFSLQDVAMQQLLEAMHQAIGMCMRGCGKMPGSGGSKELDVPSSGKGGAFIGISDIPSADFEQCFLKALQRTGGLGLSKMASLFNREKLYKQLAQEARNMALQMAGGSTAAGSWINEVDFAGTIKKALEYFDMDEKGHKQIAEFLETIRQALGQDIANWFADGPTRKDLLKNPYYFHQWAREYWDLVSRMAVIPNLLMPNLNRYAQAAKNMRNRYLPGETQLSIGIGLTSQPEKMDYFIPKQVYIPNPAKEPDMRQKYMPLIKTDVYSHAWGGAVRTIRRIKLDGYLNEWHDCKPYVLCGSGQGLEKLPPELQHCNCLWVQWDNRGLYFAYRINDARDNQYSEEIFWDTDALEIFLDPHNLKDSYRIKGRSFQFWIWPRTKRAKGCTGQSLFSSPRLFRSKVLKDGLIRFASIRSGNQYTCEAFIPAGLMERWYPLPGKIIGFNYSINNGEGVLIRWVTNMGRNISYHPELWGDLLLMGSDALMELSSDEFILPGQNLEIKITDHDMNLKAQTRDKIWIKVSSRLTGDQLPLAMMETEENSGIFSTELGTVFALKPKAKDLLSIRPGDILEIYYLDQHCSGGRKNVSLIREVQVGRGIFSLGYN